MDAAFAIFDTAIGRCAIVWRGEAVIGFALPAADDAATAAILARRHEAVETAPPPFIVDAITKVATLLAGGQPDLGSVPVALDAPPFERAVYEVLRKVRPGETITYGELAVRAGRPGAAQAVGAAMGRNPSPVIIPCHRVLAGGGGSGGFSAPGGVATKFRILEIEKAGCGDRALLFEHLPLAVRA